MPLLISLALLCVASVALALPPGGDDAAAALIKSPRHGEYVDVPVGEAKIKSFIVYPERKENAPVIIVIHEIFGLSDWVRAVADDLAAQGFIAIAPDLLSGKGPGGGGTESFKGDSVRDAIRGLKPEEVSARLNAVRAYALAQPAASKRSACIGFCWGGSASFAYATAQPGLNASVVYYGTAPKDGLDKISCPVAGFYGGNDARVTATVKPTQKAMEEASKPYQIAIYDGAGHGFLRQQTQGANKKAAEEAWKATIEFLKKNLE
jgi:carboxymethylenebutenolidase